MAFGGKINYRAWLILGQEFRDQRRIADITLNQRVARITLKALKCLGVSCVGEFVKIDDGLTATFTSTAKPIENKICANETSAASD